MCGIEVLDETLLNPKYLYFALSSMKDEVVASLMTGTSNVSLDKDDLYDIEIPFPDINTQNEIVKSQIKMEDDVINMKKKTLQLQLALSKEGKKIWN
jgi:restriction endonuclease S subunit